MEIIKKKKNLLSLSGDLKTTTIRLANIKINGRDSTFILKSHVRRSQSNYTQTSEFILTKEWQKIRLHK